MRLGAVMEHKRRENKRERGENFGIAYHSGDHTWGMGKERHGIPFINNDLLHTAFVQKDKIKKVKKQLYIYFRHIRHNINAIIIRNIHSEPNLGKHFLTTG